MVNSTAIPGASSFCLFTDLPDEILFKVLFGGYLSIFDAVQCARLNHTTNSWFSDEENQSKRRLWKQLLREEGLPGNTFKDLQHHCKEWKLYCDQVKMEMMVWSEAVAIGDKPRDLPEDSVIVAAADGKSAVLMDLSLEALKEHETVVKKNFRQYLCQAIKRFISHVSRAHSWYKHLPNTKHRAFFELYIDLTSDMRRRRGSKEFVPRSNYDYPRIGYGRRIPNTDAYRRKCGMFDYRSYGAIGFDKRRRGDLKVSYPDGCSIFVPKSARLSVPVTSVISGTYSGNVHGYSLALQHAINSGNVDQLEGRILREWNPSTAEGGKFPEGVVADLKDIAEAHLSDGSPDDKLRHLRDGDYVPDSVYGWANVAFRRQNRREKKSMARALHTVSMEMFGKDWCPDLDDVLRIVY